MASYETRVRLIGSSQNVESNTSYVTLALEFRRTDYQYYGYNATGSAYWKIDCDGQSSGNRYFTFNWTIPAWTWKEVGRVSFSIGHNADGSKSISYSGYIYFGSGVAPGSLSGSGSSGLPTIPRATVPSLSPSTVTMGERITISLPRASGSFTHNLTYTFGSKSGTIANSAGSSASFTVPTSFADALPNDVSGGGKIVCKTYSGSTLIGTKEAYFTARVPDYTPTVNSLTVAEATAGIAAKFGAYIQGKSRLKVTASGAGKYGSSIQTYVVNVDGRTYTGSSITTQPILKAGSLPVTVTVTDSRGKQASKTQTITLLAYSPPSIKRFTTYRSTTAGVENDEQSHAKIEMEFSINSLSNKNDRAYKVEARKSTDSTWVSLLSGSVYAYNGSYVKTGSILNPDYQYVVRLTVSDYFTSATAEVEIGTAFTLWDAHSSGRGFAFGKVAEKKDYLEVALKSDFNKGLSLPIEGGMKDLAGWLTSTKSALSGSISSLRNDWSNGQKSDLAKINQILSTLSGIGQVCEAGAWGSEWTLDGEYRTLGNKRNVDNKWFKTDSYYSAITAKTGGLHLLTVSSTFFPTGNTQVDFLVSKNGSAVDYSTHSMVGRTYFARTAWAISLNAGDKVDIKVRCYGTVKCNGWDVIRLVKLS